VCGAVIGWVDQHHADLPGALARLSSWRTTFMIVAVPGILIAPALLLIGPVKRLGLKVAAAPSSFVAYFRSNAVAFSAFSIAMGFYGVVAFAILSWMPPHLIRDMHMTATQTGYGIGAAIAIGTVVGLVATGVAVRLLRARFGVNTPLRLYQAAMIGSAPPLLLQIFADRPWEAFVLVGIQFAASIMGTSLAPTLLQDIGPASVRGRVVGIGTLVYTLMGSSAPILVGGLSDQLGRRQNGLLWAIELVGVPSLLFAAGIVMLADKPLQRTIRAYAPPAG
jgi:MFS family permease